MRLSRRHFLLGSAATVAASTLPRWYAGADTPATMNFALANNTGSNTVYAYVTGQALDAGNAWFLLQSDGQTPYYPSSPGSVGSPLAVDCAIPLGPSGGGATTITVPHLAGARLWFSVDQPLTFLLNPGPALVEPSVTNPSDPNINITWDFCEFTYNAANLYANISFVDFVCLPIGLGLTNTAGGQQTAPGLPNGGVDTVCSALQAQDASDGAGWGQLVITNNGQNLRALSPTNGIVRNGSLLSGYFDGYVNQVWQQYTNTTLTVNTQVSWGDVTGQVVGDQLGFAGVGAAFGRPAAADIFSGNSGPFNVSDPESQNIAARLSAAFNRGTLLTDAVQPNGENPANYYTNAITNHYARIVHATSVDGRGYAFPYDDVAPTGGADQSGAVVDPNPSLLTVTVGALH